MILRLGERREEGGSDGVIELTPRILDVSLGRPVPIFCLVI
jgi:hypothetical protein